jgi:hypothetical protein
MPVQDIDLAAVLLEDGRHMVKPHGRGLDVFRAQSGVEKIRINENYFHEEAGQKGSSGFGLHSREI